MEKQEKLEILKNYMKKTFEVEFDCIEDVEEFFNEEDFDDNF